MNYNNSNNNNHKDDKIRLLKLEFNRPPKKDYMRKLLFIERF